MQAVLIMNLTKNILKHNYLQYCDRLIIVIFICLSTFIYLFIFVSSDEMFVCLHLIYTYLHIPESPPISTNCTRVNLHVSTHTRKSTIFHELFLCKSTRIYTYPKIHHFPRVVHVYIYTFLHIPEKSTIFHEFPRGHSCKTRVLFAG